VRGLKCRKPRRGVYAHGCRTPRGVCVD